MKAGFHPLNWGLGPGKHRGAWGCSHPEPVPGQSCMMGEAVFLWPSTCHAEPGTRPPSPRVPETEAHQAPLSLGFSRQEHWSGLPFPSPMHESEK